MFASRFRCLSASRRPGAVAAAAILLALVAFSAMPADAQNASCQLQNVNGTNTYVCAAQNSGGSTGVSVSAPDLNSTTAYPLSLNVPAGTFGSGLVSTVTGYGGSTAGLGNFFGVSAVAAGPNNNNGGGNTEGLSVSNNSAISFTQAGGSLPYDNGSLYGIYAVQSGGYGNTDSGDKSTSASTGGSIDGPTNVNNTAAIVSALDSYQTYGDYGIVAVSSGTSAFAGDSFGGNSNEGPVTVTNSGAISATADGSTASVTEGAGGIIGLATGGNGHWDQPGGTAGAVTVNDYAPVTGSFYGQGGGGTDMQDGIYGILAESEGGVGGLDDQKSNAGAGGGAGVVQVTLSPGANVTYTLIDGNTVATPAGSPDAGVSAASIGGAGGYAYDGNNDSGGNGGNGDAATVDITDASVAATAQLNGDMVGVLVYSQGGAGGCAGSPSPGDPTDACNSNAQNPSENGGAGGAAGDSNVSITAHNAPVSITAATGNGDDSPAVELYSVGGAGGTGGYSYDTGASTAHGGIGGDGGNSRYIAAVLNAGQAIAISASGADSPGIYAISAGGDGGVGAEAHIHTSGSADGGNGGNGGISFGSGSSALALDGTAQGAITVTTNGDESPGLYMLSQGGNGGVGGEASSGSASSVYAGNGGSGGDAYSIEINTAYTAITTQQDSSPGIAIVATGGNGGNGGDISAPDLSGGTAGNGANGGDTQTVTVNTDANSSITTSGADAMGIVAETLSGAGGAGGSAINSNTGTVLANAGASGAGGDAGDIVIDNAADITTSGATARGILAQSLPGAGGAGGKSWGVFVAAGGAGGAGGSAGNIMVTNSGAIITGDGDTTTVGGDTTAAQSNAEGVLVQSIGGLGGAGGQAGGPIVDIGGQGGEGSTGGSATFDENGGSITTEGYGGDGALVQSIGGDGGDGGGASGGLVTIGGNGGNAASAGQAMADISQNAVITTMNDESDAVLVQSIGGGGGNAGNASALGVFAAVSVGGTGAGGGNGANAIGDLTDSGIVTQGSKSAGLVVQSIGGGGGTGGDAESFAGGPAFSTALSFGGTGGGGGTGATASADVTGGTIATGQAPWLIEGSSSNSCPGETSTQGCNTLPVDDYGVVVQSIGGGGGLGGSATAKAYTLAINDDADEIPFPAIAFGGSFGGSGGTGNTGGLAQFNLSDGGAIVTAGQGSDAVLAQSIGGGGGAGGDSSAMAAVKDYASTFDLPANAIGGNLTFGIDGGGGTGNAGGTVEALLGGSWGTGTNSDGINDITPDGAGDAGSGIVTFGDYADGITAQSIGGGGGNAGYGSGNTQGSGTTYTANVSVNLGAAGGTGGAGGNVVVGLYAPPGVTSVATGLGAVPVIPVGITTYGSGAIGVLAQSIGGGGGASQGDSISASGSLTYKGVGISPAANIEFGGNGVTGGTGGTVQVAVQAPITTHGGDAEGVLAQSVGGGGGLGGSAGSDGSQDNPVDETTDGREFKVQTGNLLDTAINEIENGQLSLSPTFDFSMGGQGGSGNTAGNVTVDVDSTIVTGAPISVGGQTQTNGDWADGVIAQSIGGGGGKGGTAMATGTGGTSSFALNLNFAIGGKGGSGGLAGLATVQLGEPYSEYLANGNHWGSFNISTSGYGAAGVVAQSLGGGGGIGSDGSDEATGAISIGGSLVGSGGTGGDATAATIYTENEVNSSITTTGAAADAVIVQSIGGGGGIGGAGSTAWVDNQASWVPADQQYAAANNAPTTLTLSLGGKTSAGAGNKADFDSSEGPVNISTSGAGAFGLLVQSIGGGGGLLSATPTGTTPVVTDLGGSDDASVSDLSGGLVILNIGTNGASDSPISPTNIVTSGPEAYGIVAQSIGGGGGVLRLAGETLNGGTDYPSLATGSEPGITAGSPSAGDGGDININISYDSSITVNGNGAIGIFAQSIGGGGGLIQNNDSEYAGSQFGDTDSGGGGGNITIVQSGPLTANGPNSIGIFAQVAGNSSTTGLVNITTYGDISYNTAGGTGSGSFGSSDIQVDSPPNHVNPVTVEGGSTLTNSAGDPSYTAISATGGGAVSVTDYGSITGQIPNGDIDIEGGSRPAALTASGYAGGVWNTTGRASGDVRNAGTLNVFGNLEVGGDYRQTKTGQLGIRIDSLNHSASHLQVDGDADISGLVVANAVSLLPGAIPIISAGHLSLSARGQNSLLFDWDLAAKGNKASFTPSAKFTGSGVRLTASEGSMAQYLQRAWTNADPLFATQFAGFSQINDAGRYTETLNAYSGKAAEAQSLALINSAGSILGAGMSCPEFGGGSVIVTEDSCVWAKLTTRQDSQWASGDIQGYHVTDATYRIGGQRELAPGWYLGGSVAGGQSWARTSGTALGFSSGYGENYDGSVALKHLDGPWLFAGSLAFAGGTYHSNRLISLPGTVAELQGKPSVFLAGIRARAGYEFGFRDWYLRPYGDLDLLYSNLPGFTESGPDQYALKVKGTQAVNVAFSPMLAIGGRLNLGPRTILHPFAAFGGSFVPGNRRDVDASIVGANAADGTFRTYLTLPDAVANLQAGLQLYRGAHIDLTAEYNAMLGGSLLGQSEMAKFTYHF